MTFNPSLIITNDEFTDISMNESDIQDFLKAKDSFLEIYEIDNSLISYWISKYCCQYNINPKVILTTAQKEQGLISAKTMPENPRQLDFAFGLGATDSGDNDSFKGFDKQLSGVCSCFNNLYQKSLTDIYPLQFKCSDGNVIISNAATQALYRYTPWVGINTNSGNWLFNSIYTEYFDNFNI